MAIRDSKIVPPEAVRQSLIVYQGNTLVAKSCPVYPQPRILASNVFDGLEYCSLIQCLAFRESSLDPSAVGDNGLAIGLLQFHRPTFNQYCEGNINNPRDQVVCADEMLKSNFVRNIKHWSTRYKCLSYVKTN